MNKKLVALAVAGILAAPLAAQADVSVSGGLQAEVVSVGGDGTSGAQTGLYANDAMEFGKVNSGNFGFLKFSAAEDLGGGLKALAMYNMNVNVAGGLASRDTYVGLAGNFGAVLAGKLSSAYKSATVKWDPFLATSLQARGSFGMSGLNNGYATNALAYAGNFGGVKVVAAIAVDSGAGAGTSTSGNHAKTFSINAPVGPVEVAIGYIDASKDAAAGAAGVTDVTGTKIGVKYSAGPLTVAVQSESLGKGVTGTGSSGTMMYAMGSYAMDDMNTVALAVGSADKNAVDGTNSGSYLAIGLNHNFSKNTRATVGYRSSKGTGGIKETAFVAGLRVKF